MVEDQGMNMSRGQCVVCDAGRAVCSVWWQVPTATWTLRKFDIGQEKIRTLSTRNPSSSDGQFGVPFLDIRQLGSFPITTQPTLTSEFYVCFIAIWQEMNSRIAFSSKTMLHPTTTLTNQNFIQ
jgi:hypothetical protein